MQTLNRKIVKLSKISKQNDDGYISADKSELFGMVWEITKDAYAFMGEKDAEQRLQRNITNLVKRKR
jgi:hypothetical protein